MFLIDKLKGVWNKMIAPKTVENVLSIAPVISTVMQDSIELWEAMYMNKSPWLNENVKPLGIPSMIASEKARTATIEMDAKITGDNERANFLDEQFRKVMAGIRTNLEYGIAFGGLIIKPYVKKGADDKYVLEFNFTKAMDFYPLSFSPEGVITEAAFIDRIITKEKVYSKVEYHKLEGNRLTVRNLAFESSTNVSSQGLMSHELGTPIPLDAVGSWAALEPIVYIDKVDTVLFAYFKMPQANTIDLQSPLGVSGFSRAISLIKDADEQYSNLLWEFEGGQLAIDVDRTASNYMYDNKGNAIQVLPKLQDRLFRRNLDLGDDNTYNVFSPQLRDTSIINGLNTILMRIEDACDISRGTLSMPESADARTATELKILKQRSYSANADIQKALQETFEKVILIMNKYCDLYNIVPSGEYEASFSWDDSIIVDKDAERQVDLLDVNAGLLSKVEYRMKWMGETRAQAEEALKLIEDEKKASMELQMSFQQQTDNLVKSDEQNKQDKLKRANESNEKTKSNKVNDK